MNERFDCGPVAFYAKFYAGITQIPDIPNHAMSRR
jgi:hypothetical protein